MIGRREREGPLMRNATHSLRKSRIVTAVVIGVLIGCILAFFFPNGFFVPSANRHLPVAGSKTQVLFSSKL
jgi:tetrahydromethanopterin S-methyltransferase subunit C